MRVIRDEVKIIQKFENSRKKFEKKIRGLVVAGVAPALLLYVSCSAGPRAANRPKTRAAARLFPSWYLCPTNMMTTSRRRKKIQ